MSQDEIVKMAREAGLVIDGNNSGEDDLFVFVNLVAAAKNEACAALLEENAMACENPAYRSLLQANAQAIREMGQDPMPLFDDWDGGIPYKGGKS